MLKHAMIIEYNTQKYPFDKVLSALFKAPVLHKLHVTYQQKMIKAILTAEQFAIWKEKIEPSMRPQRPGGGGNR